MAANEELLGELHDVTSRYLVKKTKGALEDLDAPSEVDKPTRTVSAAELSVIVALLKNNNITVKKNVGSALDELEDILNKRKQSTTPTEDELAAALGQMEFRQAH